jgi:hypothetical protein
MSDEETGAESKARAILISEVDRLESEIRRRLLVLVEHPLISEEFKSNSIVKEWVK